MTDVSSKGFRVLVVDDEPAHRHLAAHALTFDGHTVVLAQNGAEALDLLQVPDACFDAVLMDVDMPVLNGIEATRQLRADERTCHLPVLCVTGNRCLDDPAQRLFDQVIYKPYRRRELLAALAQVVALR